MWAVDMQKKEILPPFCSGGQHNNKHLAAATRTLAYSLSLSLSLSHLCQISVPPNKILIINWQIFNMIACDTPTLVIIALRPCADEINAFVALTN